MMVEITDGLLANLKNKAKKAQESWLEETDCFGTIADAEYIANANPSVILALIEEIERLRQERGNELRHDLIDQWEKEIDDFTF